MIEHIDRVPTKPNRYAVYDDNHNFLRYEHHERADEPVQIGNPFNKALQDEFLAASGTTAGTASALTLAQPGFVLADGATVRIKLHVDSGATPTLNINGTGAKSVRTAQHGEVFNSFIGKAGIWYNLVYSVVHDSYVYNGISEVRIVDGFGRQFTPVTTIVGAEISVAPTSDETAVTPVSGLLTYSASTNGIYSTNLLQKIGDNYYVVFMLYENGYLTKVVRRAVGTFTDEIVSSALRIYPNTGSIFFADVARNAVYNIRWGSSPVCDKYNITTGGLDATYPISTSLVGTGGHSGNILAQTKDYLYFWLTTSGYTGVYCFNKNTFDTTKVTSVRPITSSSCATEVWDDNSVAFMTNQQTTNAYLMKITGNTIAFNVATTLGTINGTDGSIGVRYDKEFGLVVSTINYESTAFVIRIHSYQTGALIRGTSLTRANGVSVILLHDPVAQLTYINGVRTPVDFATIPVQRSTLGGVTTFYHEYPEVLNNQARFLVPKSGNLYTPIRRNMLEVYDIAWLKREN